MTLKSPFRMTPRLVKAEHAYAASAALDAVRHDRATCPRCRSGSLTPTVDKEHRHCDSCGFIVSLDDLAIHHGPRLEKTAGAREDYFRRQARLLMLVAGGWLALALGASIFSGSSQMLAAGLLVAVPMCAGVFAMRYRAWQAATGRVYETTAPLGDFMRDEVRSVTGGRG